MSVMKVTNSNYTQEVLESNVPVLMTFSQTGACLARCLRQL